MSFEKTIREIRKACDVLNIGDDCCASENALYDLKALLKDNENASQMLSEIRNKEEFYDFLTNEIYN